jgi:hypothetical protein
MKSGRAGRIFAFLEKSISYEFETQPRFGLIPLPRDARNSLIYIANLH